MKKNLILLLFICFCLKGFTQPFQPEFSVAGFFPVKSSGREVYSMNPSWRFHKGDVPGAEKIILMIPIGSKSPFRTASTFYQPRPADV